MEHQSIRSISFFVCLPKVVITSSASPLAEICQEMTFLEYRSITMHKIVSFPASCNVADPNEIRNFLMKILLQMIETGAMIVMSGWDRRFVGRHSGQLQLFHQPVHSSDTDVYAIVTLEDVGDFINTQPFVVIRMDMEDRRSNLLISLTCGVGFAEKCL